MTSPSDLNLSLTLTSLTHPDLSLTLTPTPTPTPTSATRGTLSATAAPRGTCNLPPTRSPMSSPRTLHRARTLD
eukprot:scaffold75861_cov33-Phaeocystis_antarctica.AAC.2